MRWDIKLKETVIEFDNFQDQWKAMGIYYGYPECCVKSFCESFYRSQEQHKVHQNKGFVPCPNHAKAILRGDVTLEQLIQGRKCKTKFPGSGRDRDITIFLKKYCNENKVQVNNRKTA